MINSYKWKIGWGFTAKCNMTCPFCYSAIARRDDYEIPLQSAKRFVDINADMIESINYGTGECALSENWASLAAYIRSSYPAIRQSLTTNGSIAKQIAAGMLHGNQFACMIDEVDVSLDFFEESKHNQTRGNSNAYRWALDTLELCNSNAITPTIVMVGYTETLGIRNLEGIFRLAGKYNAFVRINILRPLKGTKLPPPSNRQMHQALKTILQRYKVVSLCDPLFGAIYDPEQSSVPEKTNSLRILPNGMITPSTYLIEDRWFVESICNDILLSHLLDTEVFHQVMNAGVPDECCGCVYKDACGGGAVDRRILHYNSLSERDPYCPLREGCTMPEKTPLKHSGRGDFRPTVHDGYLPTLIFDF